MRAAEPGHRSWPLGRIDVGADVQAGVRDELVEEVGHDRHSATLPVPQLIELARRRHPVRRFLDGTASKGPPGPPDEADITTCPLRVLRACEHPSFVSGDDTRGTRCREMRTTRGRRRSPSSKRCVAASTRRRAALLTEYRGPERRRPWPSCAGPCARPAASTRSTRTRLVRFAARDLGLELDEMLLGPDRHRLRARATRSTWPRRCATSPAPTRRWSSRAACSARTCSTPTAPGPWPRSSPARCCWPSWPAPWPRRWSSSPACSQALPRNLAYGLKALIDQKGGVARSPSRRRRGRGPRRRSRRRAEAAADETPAEAEAPADETPAETPAAAADETPVAETAGPKPQES